MKTVAFFNVKGGVGKSTSVTATGHILASIFKKKVLIVDLDPQGNTTNLFLGNELPEISIENLLVNSSMKTQEAILKTEYENLDIIPALLTLAEAEERLKANIRIPQQFRLKTHIESICKEYDYCLLDCSPSISLININGLAVADFVYIPTKCDKWSIMGIEAARNLMDTVGVYNPNLKLGGCFFTQWKGNRIVDKEAYEMLDEILGNKLLPIRIPASKLVEECTYAGKPLLAYDTGSKKSKIAEEYMKLADHIIKI